MARHEDYERTNAREWDMNLRQNNNSNNRDTSTTAASALADDWEVVTVSLVVLDSPSSSIQGPWLASSGYPINLELAVAV